jgi:hypothetical protein
VNEKRSFFAELKRRNVYKVAVAYAIVGWLLVQVATQVFPIFEIPNWASRLLSYDALKLLPFWDPLRGDPRFDKAGVPRYARVERFGKGGVYRNPLGNRGDASNFPNSLHRFSESVPLRVSM